MSSKGPLAHSLDTAGGWRVLLSTEEPRFGGEREAAQALEGDRVRLEGPGVVILERES
jgi:hypothetical protein